MEAPGTITAQPEAQAQPASLPPLETTTPLEGARAETAAQPQVEAPKEDLISRVSKVKVEPQKQDTNPFGLTKEDYDKVQADPTLSKFYKSMQAGLTKKTQELADEKRNLKPQPTNWTVERLQAEMNKPDFVQSAQVLAAQSNPSNSGLTDQEYSALTDKEKAQLQQANQRITNLEMQNWNLQQKQQDEQLKTRYANYAPDVVDTTIHKLVKGEVVANREYIWKAVDYDDAVQRAYQLGKQDRQLETTEKVQSVSMEGFNATPQSNVPQPEKGESNTAYFKRLAQRRLSESKGMNR
jgi:hypothetical protein